MKKNTCSIESCERNAAKRGWCCRHYQIWHRTGSPTLPERPTECAVADCAKGSYIRGYCNAHYLRWQRTGSPTGSLRKTPSERFWSKVDKSADCWTWTAYIMPGGYGQFGYASGQLVLAHRFAYADTYGPIPDGMEVDHICFHRACVRPEHLRLTTHKQNNEHLQGAQRNSSTQVRGVFPSSPNRWQVKVGHHGKSHYVGLYKSVAEAEAAAIEARNELFTHNDVDRRDDAKIAERSM